VCQQIRSVVSDRLYSRVKYSILAYSHPNIPEGQAEIVYKCLEPYGSIHSLEDLVIEAKSRKCASTFKQPDTSIPESLLYHLRRFIKEGWVRVVEDGEDK
jgi:hypothetical protein